MPKPMATILLLGSSKADVRLFEGLLLTFQTSSYQLESDENIARGCSGINHDDYALVLLDCQHQPEHALQILRRYRELGCTLPVIALAPSTDSDVCQRAIECGANDFLAVNKLDSYVLERCLRYTCDKRETEKKLTNLNLYDPLTGIANRILFRQVIEQAMQRCEQEQQSLALLLINIDGFKNVNQSYGSEGGDQLVMTMAQRLGRCVRKTDAIARIGGDEFTLLLDDCQQNEDIAQVAHKVIDLLSSPFMVAGHPLMVSCSIGIATYPAAGSSVDELLQHANMALLEAKRQRGSQYCFYNEETSTAASNRLTLEAELRRALRNNEFEMHYQPRVELQSTTTVGMEALIRWRHPQRGLVSPNDFIPVAEESGLIVPIGYWIIQQACQDMLRFDELGHKNMDIAINLSFKQLQDSMFVDTAKRIIEQSGVDAKRLEFELTETAIMSNYQQTYESMMALSQLGVTFSLDDFGTGFSSFAHIQRLPISALKVDRSFIRDVVSNGDDAIIVKAIINLAHNLRLQVVAEGVETAEQLRFLCQNHCDQVQGFYFSRAVPSTEFTALLNQPFKAQA
jgi:diguanylate cyclase (GGDEF)-like protein